MRVIWRAFGRRFGPSRRAGTSALVAVIAALGTAIEATSQETAADPRLLRAIDLYTGVAGHVDDTEARGLLEAAAASGDDALATMWIARVHSTGRMTFPRDEAHARSLAAGVIGSVRALAAGGDVEAAFLMGTAYDEALGVAQDHPEAMRWYRVAAHRGHVLAAHNIGNMYRDGRGVPVDHAAAAGWWLRAARAGDAIPALRLGEAYEAGRGVPPSLERARFWYGRAAAAGNAAAAEALTRLGG
jgi:TPR repeat protein